MLKSGQLWTGNFVTKDATGALSAATVGPVGTLYVAGVATADAVTISGADPYTFSVTLPVLTAGQSVGMYATATVNGVPTGGFVREDIVDTKVVSDLQDPTVAAIQSGLATASALTAVSALVDDLETRLTALRAGYLDNLSAGPVAQASALVTHDGKLDTVDGLVDTLISRLTALRAGYLDNLSAGAVATASALSTVATNITTLLARVGAFTGTGVNTILGFLKAMASKVASLPSDIGGTYDPASDSLEALRDRVETAAGWTSTSASTQSKRRGDTWVIALASSHDITGYSKLWFALKRRYGDTDTEALLFIEKAGGLTVVNGAAYTTTTDGSITVGSASAWSGPITVLPAVTKQVEPRASLVYDVQVLISGVVTTIEEGTFEVTGDVVRAVA